MKKVYIVTHTSGIYDTMFTSNVVIVSSEESAKELVRVNQIQADEHRDKMEWLKENPEECPEHLYDVWVMDHVDDQGKEWGFSMCSAGCPMCEIEQYDASEHHGSFDYEECLMEDR